MGARAKKKSNVALKPLKEDKLHIRVNQKDKGLIEKAAGIVGLNASAFVLENALRAARRELASLETLSLTKADSQLFLDLLTDPPTANRVMKEAFTEYKKRVVNKA